MQAKKVISISSSTFFELLNSLQASTAVLNWKQTSFVFLQIFWTSHRSQCVVEFMEYRSETSTVQPCSSSFLSFVFSRRLEGAAGLVVTSCGQKVLLQNRPLLTSHSQEEATDEKSRE